MQTSQEISGIVLKSFLPHKGKLSVLTRRYGKITLVVKKSRVKTSFSPGSFIKFFPNIKKNSSDIHVVFASHIVLDDANISVLKENLYWFHHILEICYYFVPIGVHCAEEFHLVKYCFELAKHAKRLKIDSSAGDDLTLGRVNSFAVMKKLCLVKLFLQLGLHPETTGLGTKQNGSHFLSVLASLDSLKIDNVSSLTERLLKPECEATYFDVIDEWLLACLQEHPHIMSFKTLLFFDKV